ncbi:hypothetical protein HGRIS_007702 [Hohenbuehelia grisea]|uniref:Elongator complex protein 4 n=1 Tax=Hohenbuehelia grisea TaxID=104357 RepID=A0ABR3J724_9AGAR
MSSFKRKTASKQTLSPGTRPSPLTPVTTITSTGIPSLDDVLGGGLPLSCSSLLLAPDSHSGYGDLVQKYFIAQGLSWGHRVCVVDDDAAALVSECMWMPNVNANTTDPSTSAVPTVSTSLDDAEDTAEQPSGEKIKIAWRYEQMKQFQTTVSSSSPGADEFCRTLDLSARIPDIVVATAVRDGKLTYVDVGSSSEERPSSRVLREISQLLGAASAPAPLRIVVPCLGSPQWGDMTTEDILLFLHSLRTLLRRHPYACASSSLSATKCTDVWGGAGWTQKLGFVSDALITLAAFTADPALSATFPSHHGLVHIHTLPAPHTLLPPSDRFSTLRGLAASAVSAGGGGGENNLAFKCTRKRLVIETMHLDVEGGVGERRTTPSASSLATLDAGGAPHEHGEAASAENAPVSKASMPVLEVQIENHAVPAHGKTSGEIGEPERERQSEKPKKARKRVAFHSDRPDLYDF